MTQTRMDSLMEAVTNTAIGLVISVAANMLVLPIFGLPVTLGGAIGIGAVMTVISIARSYLLRRLFNGRSVWRQIRTLFEKPLTKAEQDCCFYVAREFDTGDLGRDRREFRVLRDTNQLCRDCPCFAEQPR